MRGPLSRASTRPNISQFSAAYGSAPGRSKSLPTPYKNPRPTPLTCPTCQPAEPPTPRLASWLTSRQDRRQGRTRPTSQGLAHLGATDSPGKRLAPLQDQGDSIQKSKSCRPRTQRPTRPMARPRAAPGTDAVGPSTRHAEVWCEDFDPAYNPRTIRCGSCPRKQGRSTPQTDP